MNASEFRKKAEQIFNKYNVKNSRFLDSQRAEKINTYFGDLNISVEWINSIKTASIHSNYNENNIADYKQKQIEINAITGYNFGQTLKCNFYFDTPEECLNELEEYLSNMLWVNQPEERQKEIDKIYIIGV